MTLDIRGIDFDVNEMEDKKSLEKIFEENNDFDGGGSFLVTVKENTEKVLKKQTYSRNDSPLD